MNQSHISSADQEQDGNVQKIDKLSLSLDEVIDLQGVDLTFVPSTLHTHLSVQSHAHDVSYNVKTGIVQLSSCTMPK